MSDIIRDLHTLIEKSEVPKEQKTLLHQKLKEAGTDPNVIYEIREALAPTARDKAKEITDGDREPEHLGKYTVETLTQELVSLGNTKPMFRDRKWTERSEMLASVIAKQFKEDPKQYQGLATKLHDIIQGEM